MSLPGRFVDTRFGRVFVHRSGAGDPLVLVHGFAMSHFVFRHVVPALAAEADVIAIDLPGFGESDRPAPEEFGYDYAAFGEAVGDVLDALGVARATLCGSSMGGGVALAFAARRPERVEKLILVGAAVYPLPIPAAGRLLLQPRVGRLLFKYAMRRADFQRVLERESFRDSRFADEEFVDYYWARLNRVGAREASYATMVHLAALSGASSDPGRVTAPALLVWGEEDRQVPLAHGKRLQRAIAGARLEVVPASGHMPFIERPKEFLHRVRPFLRQEARPVAEPPVPASRSRAS